MALPVHPWGWESLPLIEGLVSEAGFRDVQSERVTRFYGIADPAEEWRRWSEDDASLAARGLAGLSEIERQRLRGEAMAALEAYRVWGVLVGRARGRWGRAVAGIRRQDQDS